LKELQDAFRYNDAVLRNLIIQRDAAIIEPSIMLQAKDERQERQERFDRPDRHERSERRHHDHEGRE